MTGRTSKDRPTVRKRKGAGEGKRSARLAQPLGETDGKAVLDTDAVHERIWSAIVDHSIPPETRLVESELCAIFGLGRTRMRAVLQRLAHERVVTLMRNRGAKVSRPTPEEAREVFAARRILEAGIVQTLVSSAPPRNLQRLHAHLEQEELAWRGNDRRAMLKLSGDYHLLLAEAAGNSILLELLRDLVSRSSLIIAVYQSPNTRPCPPDAHRELTGLLERGDRGAVRAMMQHLDHVVAELRLEDKRERGIDLRSVFAVSEAVP